MTDISTSEQQHSGHMSLEEFCGTIRHMEAQGTKTVKKAIKTRYDQTWWVKFGIPDKR